MISEEDEIAQDKNYCHNPTCDCPVPAGTEYCDDYCRTAGIDSASIFWEE